MQSIVHIHIPFLFIFYCNIIMQKYDIANTITSRYQFRIWPYGVRRGIIESVDDYSISHCIFSMFGHAFIKNWFSEKSRAEQAKKHTRKFSVCGITIIGPRSLGGDGGAGCAPPGSAGLCEAINWTVVLATRFNSDVLCSNCDKGFSSWTIKESATKIMLYCK